QGSGNYGVALTGGTAALFVENCVIQNFSGAGITFQPSAAAAQLFVSNTTIDNSDTGIDIRSNTGGVGVVLDRVKLRFNLSAMILANDGGPIGAVMRDSVVSSSRRKGIAVSGVFQPTSNLTI